MFSKIDACKILDDKKLDELDDESQ